jgi:excisionase family DNA binding protein
MNNVPTFLTLDEVAKLLRCSVRHIYNMVEKQGLPMTRLGRRVVVSHDALMKWIDAQSTAAVAPQPASKSQGPLWPPPKKTLTDYLCPAHRVRTMTDDERRRYFDYIAAATSIEKRRALDLDSIGFLPQTEQALRKAGLNTIGAVADKYPYELRQIFNIGPNQLAAIQDRLKSLRMSLSHACGYKLNVNKVRIPLWQRRPQMSTAEKQRWKQMSRQHKLQCSINEIEISVRAANLLNNAKLWTIGDLVSKTEAEMLFIPKLGKQSLNEIKCRLGEIGLQFAATPSTAAAHSARADY